jgi:hypothetical protein
VNRSPVESLFQVMRDAVLKHHASSTARSAEHFGGEPQPDRSRRKLKLPTDGTSDGKRRTSAESVCTAIAEGNIVCVK